MSKLRIINLLTLILLCNLVSNTAFGDNTPPSLSFFTHHFSQLKSIAYKEQAKLITRNGKQDKFNYSANDQLTKGVIFNDQYISNCCEDTKGNYSITLLSVVTNNDNSTTFNFSLINYGNHGLSHVKFEVANSDNDVVSPTNNYTGNNNSFNIETTNNPFKAINFETLGEGIKNGQSETFTYTLADGATLVDPMRIEAKAAGDIKVLEVILPTDADNNAQDTEDEFWLEAEYADVGSKWSTVSDNLASGDSYVTVQSGNNATSSAPTGMSDRIKFTFDAPSAGNYNVFARVIAPSGGDDSFWVRANGGTWYRWNSIAPLTSVWAWRQVHDNSNGNALVSFPLVAGINTIDFAYREDGALLDKIYISKGSTAPTGEGRPASNYACANAGIPNINFDTDPNGNALPAGTIPTETWAAWGVHISTNSSSKPPMIFDSSNPTGNDDDLGTPNTDFGGPGHGAGGEAGTIGQNTQALGNLLIISKDGVSSNPNDNAGGGTIYFNFDNDTDIASLELIDLDYGKTNGMIKAFDGNNNLVGKKAVIAYGDNSYQKVVLEVTGVRKLEVIIPNSFSLASLNFCDTNIPTANIGDFVWNDVNSDGIATNEVGIANVEVSLYDDANHLLAETTTDNTGFYAFENLAAGDYLISIGIPGGYHVTKDLDGNNNNDSDTFTLSAGENRTDVDFGLNDGSNTPPPPPPSACSGNATAATGAVRNGAASNATGEADGQTTEVGAGSDYLVVTLIDELPVGTQYTIHISGRGGSATTDVFEAPSGTNLPNNQQSSPSGFTLNGQATGAQDVITQVVKTTAVSTKYIYFDRGSGDIEIDAVTYDLDCEGDCVGRTSNGLIAMYNFQEGNGNTVTDVSGFGAALDLTIETPANVTWDNSCGLTVNNGTVMKSTGAATKIINAIKASNAFSVEAWVKPANNTQSGPARMVTLSSGTGLRNFTFGQDAAEYAARVRTSSSGVSNNGIPTVNGGTVSTSTIQHVVYTWDANNSGTEKIYVDGVEVYSGTRLGTTSNWDDTYEFAIANETTVDRQWLGEVYMVAVYDKALSSTEVVGNLGEGECCGVVQEICDNGIDDDMDGQTDCEDSSCGLTIDLGLDRVHCNVDSELIPVISGNINNVTYSWNNNLGSAATHSVNPTETTVYKVTVTNENGCTATDSVTLIINGCVELCDNGIDDDNDGKIDCNDEDCPCYIGDSWSFGCEDSLSVELIGIGNKNQPSATLDIENLENVQAVKVEATFSGGNNPPDVVTFTSSNGESITVDKVYFDGHSGTGGDRYFRTNMRPADSYTLNYGSAYADNGESFLLYVFRKENRNASMGQFVHKHFYRSTETLTFPIPTSPVSRDIEVAVPLSELTNDGRVVYFRATAGGVSYQSTIDNYNKGNSLYIHPIILKDVPGDATEVVVEVESPLVNGQSLYMSGAVSVNVDCFASLLVEKTVDNDCSSAGETVNYTYTVSNYGTNTVNNITAIDSELGYLSLGATSLAPGESTTASGSYLIQPTDLPGPLQSEVTVSGTDVLTGATIEDTDEIEINLIDIDFDHTADKSAVNIDEEVTYTYTVTNNGSSPVTISVASDDIGATASDRVHTDLQSLYTFKEGTGATIYDVSGVGNPYNLTIQDPNNVAWTANGINVLAETKATYTPDSDELKIKDACQESMQVTLEGWVKPANNTQTGPARMIGYTWSSTEWNYHLSQKANDYSARLRTSGHNTNELVGNVDAIASTPDWAHVVYTFDGTNAKMYVDGVAINTTGAATPTGDFSNWSGDYVITLFNEYGASRKWLGEMALAAVYDRALTPEEVNQNFEAGYQSEI